ncbi:unnamed protein product [Blepharisma stoltei]|uniref:Uncharacterized protein n=1 Tax=Blepharisma stoltei TaxID=1481888 RepID=A0AAU9JYK9_9CILI|nr:unnamed protein product [Blepharisma stoltei]
MSEPEVKKRGRRGRPPKQPEKKLKLESDMKESQQLPINSKDKPLEKPKHQNEHLESYNSIRTCFVNSGVSQQSQLLIRRIANNLSSSGDFSSQPLLRMLNDILQELAMNELEVVSWALVLDKFPLRDPTFPLLNTLLYTAYAVKSYLNEDMSPYKTYLLSKNQSFIEDYQVWIEPYRTLLNINAKEINCKFRDLSKLVGVPGDSKAVDYNYYVDEILQISPPYSHDSNKEENKKLQVKEENSEASNYEKNENIQNRLEEENNSMSEGFNSNLFGILENDEKKSG